jgi:hypothetical protein
MKKYLMVVEKTTLATQPIHPTWMVAWLQAALARRLRARCRKLLNFIWRA